MPKMKTKSSAAKRYKVTGNGKIKVKKPGLRHFMAKKSSQFKSDKRKQGYVAACDQGLVRDTLPYSF